MIAQDPIKSGLNWYGYCHGNPVSWVDPSGLTECEQEKSGWEQFWHDAGNWLQDMGRAQSQRMDAIGKSPDILTGLTRTLDFLSYGGVAENTARANVMLQSLNAYSIVNYAFSGSLDTVKGAIAPEKPLSFNHWMSSAGVVSMVGGGYLMAGGASPQLPTT